MRFSPNCGISFKGWTISVILLELLLTGVIVGLGGWAFVSRVGSEAQLLYSPKASTNYIERNHRYAIVVTSWILIVLLALCTGRIVSTILLGIGAKKSSVGLSTFWMAFKVFSVMISLFIVTASFTVSFPVKAAAIISLLTDLLTAYFIRILYPELDKMRKVIVINPVEAQKEKNIISHNPL